MVRALLAESLRAWGIDGQAEREADGAICISSGTTRVRVVTAPPQLPFRWLVTIGERQRGAVSLVAVLRQVRSALDPGYAKTRVRIASSGVLLSSDT